MDNSQIESTINEIRKRSGAVTDFNEIKISNAIYKALAATSKADRVLADQLANRVVQKLVEQGFTNTRAPSVEDIQDIAESTLIDSGNSDIAKAYIIYRFERRRFHESKLSDEKYLTETHRIILRAVYSITAMENGTWILNSEPRKEVLELEEMRYLNLVEDSLGGFRVILNPEKEEEVQGLLFFTSTLNLGTIFPKMIVIGA